MEDFIKSWNHSEPVSSKQFITEYFEWCKANDRPRIQVTQEVMEAVGVGKIIGIPKKE